MSLHNETPLGGSYNVAVGVTDIVDNVFGNTIAPINIDIVYVQLGSDISITIFYEIFIYVPAIIVLLQPNFTIIDFFS